MALSPQQKQYSLWKAAQQGKSLSKELAEIIDTTSKAIEAMSVNAKKQKALNAQYPVSKRRRVTLGKYRLKRTKRTDKASLLKCFDRRGGPAGRVHTHQWWALV
jgi:hypothetical protein